MNDHKTVEVDTLPNCDFCDSERVFAPYVKFPKAEFDGRTITGAWANMCPKHFREYGVGLGLGKGQKLIVKKNWVTDQKRLKLQAKMVKEAGLTTYEEYKNS